jgi:ornithine lipid ester-linked acyl 2-hydroxylase
LFDDTFPHRAWNDADGMRVVLFLDVLRPLSQPAALINKITVQCIAWSPFIQDAKKKFSKMGCSISRSFARSAKKLKFMPNLTYPCMGDDL